MFGKNLKRIRLECNISQKDLASKLNVSFKTISHWENSYSQPCIEQLILLKEILAVSYDELFED